MKATTVERCRRRGIGRTLPVGWMYMKPPGTALKSQLLEHVKNRRKKREKEVAERAARAKERKNEEEKKAWHKEQIAVCKTKMEEINSRRKELDDMRDKLYAQLKEVLMRNDGNKTLRDEGLLKQLMQSHDVGINTPLPIIFKIKHQNPSSTSNQMLQNKQDVNEAKVDSDHHSENNNSYGNSSQMNLK